MKRRWFGRAWLLPLLFAGSALADGAAVDKASPDEKKRAGDLYGAAMKDFEEDAYEKALTGFEASYAVVKSPNSHFMIGRTYARLGRNVEAYQELERVITEAEALGPRYAPTADSAREKQREVRPRIGILIVKLDKAPKGSRAALGDQILPLTQVGQMLPVLPGETKVALVTPDGQRYVQLVTIGEGAQETVDLERPPEAPKEVELPVRQPYRFELEAHLAGETVIPVDGVNRGAGPGVRAAWQFAPYGFFGSTDSFAVQTGIDFIGSSNQSHAWVPLQIQWNFWIIPNFSALLEAGAAYTFGADDKKLAPAFHVGARYRVYEKLYVTGRVGIPDATLGLSLLL